MDILHCSFGLGLLCLGFDVSYLLLSLVLTQISYRSRVSAHQELLEFLFYGLFGLSCLYYYYKIVLACLMDGYCGVRKVHTIRK